MDLGDNIHSTVRFPSWFNYVLDTLCDELDLSKADFIRWAVNEHVIAYILSQHSDCLAFGPKEASIPERFFHVKIRGEKEWTSVQQLRV